MSMVFGFANGQLNSYIEGTSKRIINPLIVSVYGEEVQIDRRVY